MKAFKGFLTKGFTLSEMMIVILIFSVIVVGMFTLLFTGQSTWFNTDTSIELQQTLRIALARVSSELQESGFDKDNIPQVAISDGGGFNGSDIIRFSVPVICEEGGSLIDANGDVAYWGAPLTWGCAQASCMDADDDCLTTEYRYIEYSVNNQGQLSRRVLDSIFGVVREDIFAGNINDFQVNTSLDGNIVTLQISAQKKSGVGKTISASATLDVYLRNRG